MNLCKTKFFYANNRHENCKFWIINVVQSILNLVKQNTTRYYQQNQLHFMFIQKSNFAKALIGLFIFCVFCLVCYRVSKIKDILSFNCTSKKRNKYCKSKPFLLQKSFFLVMFWQAKLLKSKEKRAIFSTSNLAAICQTLF